MLKSVVFALVVILAVASAYPSLVATGLLGAPVVAQIGITAPIGIGTIWLKWNHRCVTEFNKPPRVFSTFRCFIQALIMVIINESITIPRRPRISSNCKDSILTHLVDQ
jgi:hypothetical protein